ncbi:MAG: metallophosphoesterase [Candidatus Thorarchaeota archaeon]|nr:metallophosphoesterase [Candidatus Thorarchaeota archaeon]
MRIAAISDLHIRPDGSDDDFLTAIRQRLEVISPDVFVIAGDISDNIAVVEKTLSAIKLSNAENLYVAGNHDIWFEKEKGIGSLEKYSRFIGDACTNAGFHHLPDEPFIKDNVAFVGSLGWYDYSFRRDELNIPEESYLEKEWQGSYWRDYYTVDLEYTDREFTELLNSKLEYDLSALPENIETVIYISHHLPFGALTPYKDSLPWDFFSAFMGAESTGEILLNDERVKLSISGHSHVRRQIFLDGLLAVTVPVGYGRPENDDFTSLVHDGIAELELTDGKCKVHHYVDGDICEGLPYAF